ncbi:MAG: InlB B-repeat-containing protein [Methanomassiliicoccaceae archaeon]|nr:InlB B-repeat-containing protein [Methanomassiliicoccaceae archaeon]
MSAYKKKIIITTLSLVLFTSLAVIFVDQTATSVDADTIDDLLADLGSLGPDDPYLPSATVILPALSAGATVTIDGMRGGVPTTVSDSALSPDPLFVIAAGNMGTYVFENLIIEGYAMEIETGGGGDRVVFENVVFAGNRDHTIVSNCSDLVIRSCIIQGGSDIDITVESGDLTITDSVLYSTFYGYVNTCVYAATDGKVSVENCYIDNTSIEIDSDGMERSELSIRDCTFVGPQFSYSVEVTLPESVTGITLDLSISGSLFTSKDGITGGPAVSVSGVATGSIVIEQCQFGWLGSNYYPLADPVVSLDIYSAPISFLISDTTFCSNYMGDYLTGPPTMLYIVGMTGEIVNSTFWNNMLLDRASINADDRMGCVVIEDAQVELTNNTFLDNYYVYNDGSDVLVPASLEIIWYESVVDMVNNIFVCQYGYDEGFTSTILDEDSCITTLDRNIDGVGLEIHDSIFPYFAGNEGNDGSQAGFSQLDRSAEPPMELISVPAEIETATGAVIYTPVILAEPAEIITVPILPFGDADGWGAAGAPEKDQRGKPRSELTDLGSVSIDTAVFFAMGGYWDIYPYSGYNIGDRYRFMLEEGIGIDYDKAAAIAGEDGSVSLPPDYWYTLLMHPELRFLGWSTEYGAAMPDPMFVVDTYGTMLGEFTIDMVYFATWGEDFVIVFEPQNGSLTPVVKVVVPDVTIGAPLYGTVNGMRLVKWVDEHGNDWDPNDTHPDGNMIVYGVWAAADPPAVSVEFRNGEQSNMVSVPYGGTVPKPADPVRNGYEFKGWFTAAEGGTMWNFSSPVTASMVLYAQWEELTMFTVTFDPCNGALVTTVQVGEGQRVTAPQVSRQGYSLEGWFTAAEGGTRWDFNTGVTGSITLYAQWREGGIVDDGDGGFDTTDGAVVAAVVFASVVASFGIIPIGMAGGSSIASQAAISNVFQQGMFAGGAETSGEEKNRRSVVFSPMNGRPTWTSSVFIGRLVSRPADPRPPKGMRFSHWSESPNGPEFSFMTPITKVTHIYAVYVENDKGRQ